jgi:hypothetical protein
MLTRIALAVNSAVATIEQQLRALHRHRFDVVDAISQLPAQLQAGIDHGMKDNAGRIRLVGILGDFPALAEPAGQFREIGP